MFYWASSLFALAALLTLAPNVAFAGCPNGSVGLGIEADCLIGGAGGCTSFVP